MAERVGFEPTNELPHRWFSRPVLSTAQPPLQIFLLNLDYMVFYIIYMKKQLLSNCQIYLNSILLITMIDNLLRFYKKYYRNEKRRINQI